MMDSIVGIVKELLTEFQTRIRSRVITSCALGFILWNWKEVVVLLLGTSLIEAKVETFTMAIHKDVRLNYGIPLIYALIWIYGVPGINIIVEVIRDKFYLKLEGERHIANISAGYRIKQKILENDNKMFRDQNDINNNQIKAMSDKIVEMQYKLQSAAQRFVAWNDQKSELSGYIKAWDKDLHDLSTRNCDPLAINPSLQDTATAILVFHNATQGLQVNYLGTLWVSKVNELSEMLRKYCAKLPFDEQGKVTNAGIDPEETRQTIKTAKVLFNGFIERWEGLDAIQVDSLFPELGIE